MNTPEHVYTLRIALMRSFLVALFAALTTVLMAACNDPKPPSPARIPAQPTPVVGPTNNGEMLPILFLHGFRGSPFQNEIDISKCRSTNDPEAYARANAISIVTAANYENMDSEWQSLGYKNIFYGHYLSHPCYTSSYKDAANELGPQIQAILSDTHQSQVIIIAHSTGGLVAREYIESDPSRTDVAALITLGAPFNGVVISNNWFGILSKPGVEVTRNWIADQHVEENFSWAETHDYTEATKRNPHVRYYLIGGQLPF